MVEVKRSARIRSHTRKTSDTRPEEPPALFNDKQGSLATEVERYHTQPSDDVETESYVGCGGGKGKEKARLGDDEDAVEDEGEVGVEDETEDEDELEVDGEVDGEADGEADGEDHLEDDAGDEAEDEAGNNEVDGAEFDEDQNVGERNVDSESLGRATQRVRQLYAQFLYTY